MNNLDNHFNKVRWTISNKTNIPLSYTITGFAHSAIRQHCIALYVKLPEEVSHLHFPKRLKSLELLGIDSPDEAYEEDFPLLLINKVYGARSMSEANKYSFFRNFRKTALQKGIDVWNPDAAKKLIGQQISTKFIQMRKLNTDIKFWAIDRVGIELP